MKTKALTVGIGRVGDELVLRMNIHGKLTHEDYEAFIPVIENALVGIKEPKIKALIDARDFDGWESKAAWDDLKFGIKHAKEFTKIAWVGNKKWQKYMVKISDWFSWLTGAEMEYFENIEDANEWLAQEGSERKDMDAIEKELLGRKDEIKRELRFLYKANMRITDWDVPELDRTKASEILIGILQDGLDELKKEELGI